MYFGEVFASDDFINRIIESATIYLDDHSFIYSLYEADGDSFFGKIINAIKNIFGKIKDLFDKFINWIKEKIFHKKKTVLQEKIENTEIVDVAKSAEECDKLLDKISKNIDDINKDTDNKIKELQKIQNDTNKIKDNKTKDELNKYNNFELVGNSYGNNKDSGREELRAERQRRQQEKNQKYPLAIVKKQKMAILIDNDDKFKSFDFNTIFNDLFVGYAVCKAVISSITQELNSKESNTLIKMDSNDDLYYHYIYDGFKEKISSYTDLQNELDKYFEEGGNYSKVYSVKSLHTLFIRFKETYFVNDKSLQSAYNRSQDLDKYLKDSEKKIINEIETIANIENNGYNLENKQKMVRNAQAVIAETIRVNALYIKNIAKFIQLNQQESLRALNFLNKHLKYIEV